MGFGIPKPIYNCTPYLTQVKKKKPVMLLRKRSTTGTFVTDPKLFFSALPFQLARKAFQQLIIFP